MKFRSIAFGATLAAFTASLSLVPVKAASPAGETIKPAFRETIPNIAGKSLVAILVTYQPGGKSLPHHHARSAFVTGYVLPGAIRSQVDGGKVQVFHAGETWTEAPGTHHDISENASATEPASLLAIFVADTDNTELTTFEP